MNTFKDIQNLSKTGELTAFTDPDFPAGHFLVPTTVLGITTFYLFEGELRAPEARIVGRLESPIDGASTAYRGNGIKGGSYLRSNISLVEAVNLIVVED